MSPASKSARGRRAADALRAFALAYPEAHEDFPWGESVAKVRGKVFVFFGGPEGGLHLSVKLPQSGLLALGLPFASPTGYGLGKAGWVSARFAPTDEVPLGVLKQWIDESYRAVAPKKLVAALVEPPGEDARRAPRARPAPRKRGR